MPKPKPKAEANTFHLPRGDAIRTGLRDEFRSQRKRTLAAIGPPTKAHAADPLPDELPDFALGALKMSERFTPLLEVFWDKSGTATFTRLGLDPDRWEVTNPHTADLIRRASLDFCAATNATTSLTLAEALTRTREELIAGVVTSGESIPQLTKRVNRIFDGADKYRARSIAQSEASRAVHAAQEEAGRQSGIVAGWEWLLSSDACPICQTIGRRAKFVPMGRAFATIGDHASYSEIRFPPAHPHCNCSLLEVLDDEVPDEWAQTLVQPEPEAEDKPDEKSLRRPRRHRHRHRKAS